MKKIKYLSLFSGIGGFELGIKNSKYGNKAICIGYSEVDRYADSIYRKRFPSEVIEGIQTHKPFGDVTKIDTSELPDFDLLVGGFPCQSFSLAGKGGGFDDTRGTLFFEIARILKDKRPRYFLLENVRNLLSHDKGKTFSKILEVLSEVGYHVEWEVLNSKQFVPQNRERIFIKGYFREKCGSEILLKRRESKEIDNEIKKRNNGIIVSGNFSATKHGGAKIYDSNGISPTLLSESLPKNGLHIIEKENNKNEVIKLNDKQQAQAIYSPEGLSCTLLANSGGDGGKTGLYLIPNNFEQIDEDYMTHTRSTDTSIQRIGNVSPTNHWKADVLSSNGISRSLAASDYKDPIKIIEDYDDEKLKKKEPLMIRSVNKKGYEEAHPYDGVRIDHLASKTSRGRVQKNQSGTLTCDSQWGTLTDEYRVRRLIPLECERLQGFPDNWTQFGANGEKISDTQRYKCCGNAVTTQVITHIFNNWDLNV